MIQTLDSKESCVIYYRTFTCYSNSESENVPYVRSNSSTEPNIRSHFRPQKVFETSTEMKELLQHVANKVQMQFTMKMKHSLLPDHNVNKETSAKGIFMERKWKPDSGLEIPVVWHSTPGLGFVLLCNRQDNNVQAHNVLSIIIQQLEKHLQFVSNPALALTVVETVGLIVNQFLPSGQLLFMNSRLVRQFEKQLERDLFTK